MSRVGRSLSMPTLGTVLAFRYRLEAPLGQGGAAQAFVARDLVEHADVALKLLHPALPMDMLRREFERLRQLSHPHLARVHDFARVTLDGTRRALYTAELVRGGDLAACAAQAPVSLVERACCDVLDALHWLHRLGLRHGDVKPDNVLLDEAGRAVLIDLGCAAPLGQALATLSGTPGYMAPELRAGHAADERADLYAFGMLLRALGLGDKHGALIDTLTHASPERRPSSAREVLALLGDTRDVSSSTRGRATSCLGRDVELTSAERTLEQVARAEPGRRAVWVQGPAGVGRSRFVRELCDRLASAELHIVPASAHEQAPVRSALARRSASPSVGFEALLEELEDVALASEGHVLVLDDAHMLEVEARQELTFALRSLPQHGRLAMLVASSEPPPALVADVCQHVELRALRVEDVAAWAADQLPPARMKDLWRYTGGYPRYLERALAALSEGRLRASELTLARAEAQLDQASARALTLALAGLSVPAQRVLAQVALLGEVQGPVPQELLTRDLLVAHGERVTLARQADAAPVLASLDDKLRRSAALQAARVLEQGDQPEAWARAIAHYVLAGKPREARALYDRALPRALSTPRAFVSALSPCVSSLSGAQRVSFARLLRLAGEARRALSELACVRRTLSSSALFVEAAELSLALGRPARAERYLARVADLRAPEHAELQARVLVRRGGYERARVVVEAALELDGHVAVRARLLETLALTQAYLGDFVEARARVDAALSLHALEDARARARCLSLRGFVALRAGQSAEAASAYAEAFALAEPHGLVDLVLNALSNSASARQSLGQYGGALDGYERALRLASALGRNASVCSLRANLANLSLELGGFERARHELDLLSGESVGSVALHTGISLYRAELAVLQGRAEEARTLLEDVLQSVQVPHRERVEARVLALTAALDRGDVASRDALLTELVAEGGALAVDLQARVAEVVARAHASLGHAREGIAVLEHVLRRARTSDDQALLARLEGALGALCRVVSASSLAREYDARARARWERIALDLPATLREAFWAHPCRSRLAVRAETTGGRSGRATLSLSRVRELNRRIGTLRQRDEVLAYALDAAIELTAAERGFVLLREGDGAAGSKRARTGGLTVAAAQNMDSARMRKSEWKWSRSIAERVLREGEPVLTVDAGSDPRFARQASVHAMQLKSVLCAPVRGQNGIVGALYLDNRLARARFAEEDAELLLTFADQVAIALAHADLVQALERQARELSRAKRKLEELARGQASEIERLSDELSAHRATLATRFDYRDIVGRSEAMRRVLSVLDRVTESDLSVLVQGESGTGKELVARALHMNGPRKHMPFVGINCAALPEALLESELFGHVKGAFTGASHARDGLFVSARGGTLFLDELGDLPLSMQAKLLRVLNDGEVRAVGATRSQSVDVRLVCATNKNLKQAVLEGSFREDLYYRVSVVELTLPPLRERHEDIVPIAESILQKRAAHTGEPPGRLSAEAVRALLSHAFPGNVRELENTLLRATVMASGGVIRAEDLALSGQSAPQRATASTRSEYVRKEAERLLSALEAARWNVSKVAKNLGIPRNTLYRKLARHGIQRAGE